MRLEQRQINLGLFGLIAVGAAATAITYGIAGDMLTAAFAVFGCLLFFALLFVYWRGWEYARPLGVIGVTLIVMFGLPEPYVSQEQSFALLVPAMVALILTGPAWVLGSSTAAFITQILRAGGGVYTEPQAFVLYIMVVGGLILSRIAHDNAQRLSDALALAAKEQERAEEALRVAHAQAAEIEQRAAQQQKLLELVSVLETPAVAIADGVLLAPIVGTLDSRRAQELTSRLLSTVSDHRTRLVIIDLLGVAVVDSGVVQALLHTAQALRLLGCAVTITGVTPAVADTLVRIDTDLNGLAIARAPQEALERFYRESGDSIVR